MMTDESEFAKDEMSHVTIMMASNQGQAVEMDENAFQATMKSLQLTCFKNRETGEETWLPTHSIVFVIRRSQRQNDAIEAKKSLAAAKR